MRDAPAIAIAITIAIAQLLMNAGAEMHTLYPEGMEETTKLMPRIHMKSDAREAADQSDNVAVVAERSAYQALDLKLIKSSKRGDVLGDLRKVHNM